MAIAKRRVRTRDIIDELSLSKGTVHIIVHQHLQYSKVCTEWVPKHLIIDNQEQRMSFSLQHLIRYEEDLAFLRRIVAGDESWWHHYTPESKKTSMQWKHIISSTN
ncbi:hypothetical protein AVEN_83477-1 [Araneus ventricosus]|uniref:Histone-lysine N-methyltransferase SETMAR n=1 Tax=Araneus ventricosus TaxID=182803 RepID=A0A4Y2I3F9_ARAVE|nr:hypothetical protein AVEN_83477-1 [Araneus ventricosus]